jgi:hypothetical protein
MPIIDNHHLWIDGSCGPAGVLLGHIQRSCPRQGITFQCPHCERVATYSWKQIDGANKHLEDTEQPYATFLLPPCPDCDAVTMFGLNDVEYGVDLPEHATMRAVREHVATRRAFRNLQVFPASRFDGKYQGSDFSHLPEHERPTHHVGREE